MAYRFQFQAIWDNWDLLLNGVLTTVQFSAVAVGIGLGLGVLGAVGRTSGGRLVGTIVTVYVEVMRNTPFLIQLLFIFFGLPAIGLRLSSEQAALFALSINFGAYAAEIMRAGIEGIDRGQIEAGLSLGLNRIQVFRHVVLKPAIATIYPALIGQIVLLLLLSSVVSQISVEELTFVGNFLRSRTFRDFEVYIAVAAIYVVLVLLFKLVAQLVHRWLFRFTRYI
ncbi:MAG: amino acid ABC transporter permease [Cyanobacteria bacterium P01_E01_bin.45]